jgi:phenylalanyl-tRNA synthetase beta chain
VPYWRCLDAIREIDLVEEIGRVHGLDKVPIELPRIPPGRGGLSREQQTRRTIEDHLAGAGLREVVTLSLVDAGERQKYTLGGSAPIGLRNPLSSDLSELRVSLLPSLLEVVRRNRAVGVRDMQAYELGRTYRPSGDDGLAIEDSRLGIVLSGNFGGSAWTGVAPPADFRMITAVVDALLSRLGIGANRVRDTTNPLLHPGRSARVVVDNMTLGYIGELHPGLAMELDLNGPIALADFDLSLLSRAVPSTALFREVSTFPPVRQDIAMIVSSDVEAASLIATVRDVGGDLVTEADVFDVFADPEKLGAGQVSLAMHLAFQARDRTLVEDEVSAVRDRVVAALSARFGAELRG